MTTKNSRTNEIKKFPEPTILVAIFSAIATVVVAFFGYYTTLATTRLSIDATATVAAANRTVTPTPVPPKTPTLTISTPISIGTLSLSDQVETLSRQVSSLQTQVAGYQDQKQELDSVNNRLTEMENVVQQNPSQAMAYVVLRKDLDVAQSDIKDLRDRLTSSWTQNLPLYGLVVTVGFTLLSIVRSDRKQEQNKNNTREQERKDNQNFE